MALLTTCVIATLMAGCQLIGSNRPEEARIIFGRSIDDVSIGDDTTAVARKLGRPNAVLFGDFPGVVFIYTEGKYAGLDVVIWTETGQGVQVVQVTVPYKGETANGLGLGTSRMRALRFLGDPDSSGEGAGAGSIGDLYCYDDMKFGITYREDRIRALSMSALFRDECE